MAGRVAPFAPTSINVSVTHKIFSTIIRWSAWSRLFRRQIEARGPLTSASVIVTGCASNMKTLGGGKIATVHQRVDLHNVFRPDISAFLVHGMKNTMCILICWDTQFNLDTLSMDCALVSPKLMYWFNHWYCINLDAGVAFKKSVQHQSANSLQSFFWPGGVAKNWLQKSQNDWLEPVILNFRNWLQYFGEQNFF